MPVGPNETQLLAPSEHIILGSYLIATGLLSWIMNGIGIAAFCRFPKILCTASAIPEMAMLIADFCVATMHPFSGSAAIVNKWIWGSVGCQLYGMFGFLFGNFQCLCVPFIAVDRYIVSCEMNTLGEFRTKGNYVRVLAALLLLTLFFAIMPLVGWGGYALTPTGVSCSIDWTRKDISYVSYVTALFITIYLVPIWIGFSFYRAIIWRKIQGTTDEIHWAPKYSLKYVSYGCLLTTYMAFSVYAVVSLWPFFDHYTTIPSFVNILPPPCGKLAGIFNPVFYIALNPKMRACIRKMFGLSHNKQLTKTIEEDEQTWFAQILGLQQEEEGPVRCQISVMQPSTSSSTIMQPSTLRNLDLDYIETEIAI